jgi:2-phospho-L-lactate guanylyltransferase
VSWTAIVPLKGAGERKSRLAGTVTPAGRIALSEAMLAHVAAVLGAHPRISRLVLLSAAPPLDWAADWKRDEGRGLNAELEAVATEGDRLVIHADLPLLCAPDLDALLDAAAPVAIAPDARGQGTNALALRDGVPLVALFGEESFARFRAAWPGAAIVRRPGLALDVDTPVDLARARSAGFAWCDAAYTG